MAKQLEDANMLTPDRVKNALRLGECRIHNVQLLDVTAGPMGEELLTVQVLDQGESFVMTGGARFGEFSGRDIGRVGYLEAARFAPPRLSDGECWFRAYLDQTLRRAPEFDAPMSLSGFPGRRVANIGWVCESKPMGFRAPAGLVPGVDGRFVPDETVQITLNVPPEFVRLCRQYQRSPEELLRGFIADAAELHNLHGAPRADGFSSNGSDERDYAEAWIERAYAPWRVDIHALEEQDAEEEEREDQRIEIGAYLDDVVADGGDADAFLDAVRDLADRFKSESSSQEG